MAETSNKATIIFPLFIKELFYYNLNKTNNKKIRKNKTYLKISNGI